jgi:hypothetical protein
MLNILLPFLTSGVYVSSSAAGTVAGIDGPEYNDADNSAGCGNDRDL